jgi:hypothetical protein
MSAVVMSVVFGPFAGCLLLLCQRRIGRCPSTDAWGQKLTLTNKHELNDFLNGDVAKHGREEQGLRRYYAARRWMLSAASRITSYTRRGWESIGT